MFMDRPTKYFVFHLIVFVISYCQIPSMAPSAGLEWNISLEDLQVLVFGCLFENPLKYNDQVIFVGVEYFLVKLWTLSLWWLKPRTICC